MQNEMPSHINEAIKIILPAIINKNVLNLHHALKIWCDAAVMLHSCQEEEIQAGSSIVRFLLCWLLSRLLKRDQWEASNGVGHVTVKLILCSLTHILMANTALTALTTIFSAYTYIHIYTYAQARTHTHTHINVYIYSFCYRTSSTHATFLYKWKNYYKLTI